MRKSAVDLWRKVHYTCDSEKYPCSVIGNRKKERSLLKNPNIHICYFIIVLLCAFCYNSKNPAKTTNLGVIFG